MMSEEKHNILKKYKTSRGKEEIETEDIGTKDIETKEREYKEIDKKEIDKIANNYLKYNDEIGEPIDINKFTEYMIGQMNEKKISAENQVKYMSLYKENLIKINILIRYLSIDPGRRLKRIEEYTKKNIEKSGMDFVARAVSEKNLVVLKLSYSQIFATEMKYILAPEPICPLGNYEIGEWSLHNFEERFVDLLQLYKNKDPSFREKLKQFLQINLFVPSLNAYDINTVDIKRTHNTKKTYPFSEDFINRIIYFIIPIMAGENLFMELRAKYIPSILKELNKSLSCMYAMQRLFIQIEYNGLIMLGKYNINYVKKDTDMVRWHNQAKIQLYKIMTKEQFHERYDQEVISIYNHINAKYRDNIYKHDPKMSEDLKKLYEIIASRYSYKGRYP